WTSAKYTARRLSELSKVNETSAIPVGWRVSLPLKITSCMWLPRSALALCSPRHHRMASRMLLLPQPFGPTMEVMPFSSLTTVRSAKDLKPVISICLKYMLLLPRCSPARDQHTWGGSSRQPQVIVCQGPKWVVTGTDINHQW